MGNQRAAGNKSASIRHHLPSCCTHACSRTENNGEHWQHAHSLHKFEQTWVAASLQHASITCPPCWAHASSSGRRPPSCCCQSCPPSPADPWCCQSPTGHLCDSWSSCPAQNCRHMTGSKSIPAARCATSDAPLPEHMLLMAKAMVTCGKQAGCRCKVGCLAQSSRCSMQRMQMPVASQQVVASVRQGADANSRLTAVMWRLDGVHWLRRLHPLDRQCHQALCSHPI